MAYRLRLFIAVMMCPVLLCAKAAPEPRWIAAELPAPTEEPTRFLQTFHLAHAPARTWVRVHAHDRYRLIVNARPVSVGDTTWDAETYDISSFATVGTNRIEIAADADTRSPANCFVWLRRRLSAPAALERLSFRTRDARREEWLYIEVVDDKGRTSGFYCVELRRRDLLCRGAPLSGACAPSGGKAAGTRQGSQGGLDRARWLPARGSRAARGFAAAGR